MTDPLAVGQLRMWSHRMPKSLIGRGTRDGLLFTVVALSDGTGGVATILWAGGLEDDWAKTYLRDNSVLVAEGAEGRGES